MDAGTDPASGGSSDEARELGRPKGLPLQETVVRAALGRQQPGACAALPPPVDQPPHAGGNVAPQKRATLRRNRIAGASRGTAGDALHTRGAEAPGTTAQAGPVAVGPQSSASAPAFAAGPAATPASLDAVRATLSMDFHEEVLSWSFHAGLPQESIPKIPDSFRSPEHYVASFLPLLLEEVRAQMRQELERSGSARPHRIPVSAIQVSRNFSSPTFAFLHASPAPRAFVTRARDADVVLLGRHPDCVRDATQPHVLGLYYRGDTPACAKFKVLARRLEEEFGRKGTGGGGGGGSAGGQEEGTVSESGGGDWWVWRLTTLVSAQREYAALQSVGSYHLRDVLLAGR